jgi:hypothetical protein
MNPLLVVVTLGSIIAYLVKQGKGNPNTAIVVPTPLNSPIGITTGFPSPLVTADPTQPTSSGTQANNPSTSGSGVPNSAPQTLSIAQANTQPIPSAAAQVPSFYDTFSPFSNDMYSAQPPIAPVVPFRVSDNGSGGGCGCGGGCSSKRKGPSTSCSSTRATASNDCMAPSSVAMLKNTPPRVLSEWAANVASTKFGIFSSNLNVISNQEANNENGNGQGKSPASPFLDGIGIGNNGFYGNG